MAVVLEALRGKPWTTTPDLIKATGLTKPQLGAVLKEFADQFRHRRDPEFNRRYQWKLKEEGQNSQ